MSGIIGSNHFATIFEEVRNNATMQGLVTAIYEIGCLIGAIFILGVGDLLGRRKAMILGGLIMIIGATIQVTAFRAMRRWLNSLSVEWSLVSVTVLIRQLYQLIKVRASHDRVSDGIRI